MTKARSLRKVPISQSSIFLSRDQLLRIWLPLLKKISRRPTPNRKTWILITVQVIVLALQKVPSKMSILRESLRGSFQLVKIWTLAPIARANLLPKRIKLTKRTHIKIPQLPLELKRLYQSFNVLSLKMLLHPLKRSLHLLREFKILMILQVVWPDLREMLLILSVIMNLPLLRRLIVASTIIWDLVPQLRSHLSSRTSLVMLKSQILL